MQAAISRANLLVPAPPNISYVSLSASRPLIEPSAAAGGSSALEKAVTTSPQVCLSMQLEMMSAWLHIFSSVANWTACFFSPRNRSADRWSRLAGLFAEDDGPDGAAFGWKSSELRCACMAPLEGEVE